MSKRIDNSPKYMGYFWRMIAMSLDYVFWIALQIPVATFDSKFESSSLLTFIYLSAFVAYFCLLPKFGRATLGQYIMGYRIVAAPEGRPKYLWRLAYVCGTVVMWPFFLMTRFLLRGQDQGLYWWDVASNTRAVKTRD